ncbi:MAG: ABC transporter permease [Saprospiraceae bacterium]|nr:ABC transporter permease [Saprospiraceae bacterium]
MWKFLARRLLIFLPTLIVISFLAFGLSTCTPGDPVMLFLNLGNNPGAQLSNPTSYENEYREMAASLGIDKPVFYFTITTSAYPDTLHHFVQKERRECVRALIARYGNWPQIEHYYQQIALLNRKLFQVKGQASGEALTRARATLPFLYIQDKDPLIRYHLDTLQFAFRSDSALQAAAGAQFDALNAAYGRVKQEATPSAHWIPAFYWHGADNQYHRWLLRLLQGDLGVSYRDRLPVAGKLATALRWTLLINGLAILLAYGLAIPLGVYAAVHRGARRDRLIAVVLFALHSLPVFWIATLMIIFFTTPEYGMDWFPTMGVGDTDKGDSSWQVFTTRVSHLTLPVICLTYGSLAFISRQMRSSMVEALEQDFVRTARAKGLRESVVIWKHAFRNALSPIVTMLASVLPAAIAGSVVIEVIFGIPGMGKLTVDAIGAKDWPIVYAVLMLAALVTMAGILLADVLYGIIDPRVTLGKKKES